MLLPALLAACGQAPESRQPDPEGARPGRSAVEAMGNSADAAPTTPAAPPQPARTTKVEAETEDYAFFYEYPAEAAAVPALASWLDADRAKVRRDLAKDGREGRAEAKANGFPYNKYDANVGWSVVTDTPRFLSLSVERNGDSGGAHGYLGYGAALWDKKAGARVEPVALFRSAAAMDAALRPAFCRALDAARAEKREEPVVPVADDPFTQCPKLSEVTIIPGSRSRRAIDRIGFLIDPYVAGPWAEGPYDLTLPVTPAVAAAVKLEYRDAFAAR